MANSFNVIIRAKDGIDNGNFHIYDATFNVNWNSIMPYNKNKKYKVSSSFFTDTYEDNEDVSGEVVNYEKQWMLVHINLQPSSNFYDTSRNYYSGTLLGVAKRTYKNTDITTDKTSYYTYTMNDCVPIIVDGGAVLPQIVNVKLYGTDLQATGDYFLRSTDDDNDTTDFGAYYTLILNFEEVE